VLLRRQAADCGQQEETRGGDVVVRPLGRRAGHRSADRNGRRHVLRQVEEAVASVLLLLLRLVCRAQVRQADLLLLPR